MKRLIILFLIMLLAGINTDARTIANNKKVAGSSDNCFRIAVCDWMILKRQKIGAFDLAKRIGSNGLELDMGSLGKRDSFDNKLRDPHFQKMFLDKSAETGIQVSSIAMSGFYARSFVSHHNYRYLIEDCIATMKLFGAKVAFLPLGVEADLQKNPEIRSELVKRLKIAGKMATKAGVVIGIETSLPASEEVKLLQEIDSKGIKIYFNFQNPLEAGRDIYSELRILGKDRICMIHATDTDGVTLPNNSRLNLYTVKKVLNEMGWCGWLVVERSRNKNDVRNVQGNFSENVNYLKQIFQTTN